MPVRRARRRGKKRLYKRLLIVFIVLAVVAGIGFGIKHFVDRGSGAELQKKAEEAHQALVAGKFDRARLLYEGILEELPRKIDIRRNLTICYIQLKKPDQARRIAKGTLKFAPEHAPTHRTLAMLAESEGDLEVALQHAEAAMEGKASPADSKLYLAKLYLSGGRLSDGVKALSEAVFEEQVGDQAALLIAPYVQGQPADDPVAAQVRRTLGGFLKRARKELTEDPANEAAVARCVRLALLSSRPDDAIAVLNKVTQVRELNAREKVMYSEASAAVGRVAEARKFMREASFVSPAGAGPSRPTLTPAETAAGWLRAGEPQKALEAVDGAIGEAPEDLALHRIRVRALFEILRDPAPPRSPAEVLEEFEEAATELLRLLPTDEQALRYRGAVRLDRGEFAGALADAKALREVAPQSRAAQWLLGLAYHYVGMPTHALPLLVSGRGGATSEASASRWILRVALRCGKSDIAAAEAALLRDPGDSALRAAAMAMQGKLDEAEALTSGPDYGRCPAEDRARLALALAEGGRPAQARAVAAELQPLSVAPAVSLRIYELLRAAGDTDGARAALHNAAAGGGAAGIRSLLILGEEAVVKEPPDEAALAAAVGRLNQIPGGAPFARILEGRAALARGEADVALAAAREARESELPIPAARVLILAALQAKGVEGAELEQAAAAVLEVSPGYAPARQIRARAIMRSLKQELGRGQVREAEGLATRFLELQPQQSGAQLLRGLLRSQIGEAGPAEADANALLGDESTAAAGHLLKGLIRYREGAVDRAVEQFHQAVKGAPKSAGAAAALGLSLVAAGRPGEALPIADRMDELEGGALRATQVRVSALVALKRHAEAVDALQGRLDANPDELGTRILRGRILVQADRKAEAADEFAKVIQARPELADGHVLLVSAQLSLGRHDDALATAEAAIARDGLELVGILLRSRVNAARKDTDAELRDLRLAIEKYPDHPAARELLGTRLIETGSTQAGADELRRVIEMSPGNVGARFKLGMLAEAEKRVLDAVRYYKEVLQLDPRNIIAANNLAYRLLEDPATQDRAIALAGMAVRGNPQEGEFRDTYALALSAAGRHEDAAREAEEGMRLLPKKSSIALTAAKVYHAAGNVEKAQNAAARALRNASDAERESVARQVSALQLPPIR